MKGFGVKKSWIRKGFEPATDGPSWFERLPPLPKVSHWVAGDVGPLLLEPVVLHRPTLYDDIAAIGMALNMYRDAPDRAAERGVIDVGVYLVGDDPHRARSDVARRLDSIAQVFDLDRESGQRSMAHAIQARMATAADAK